MEKKIYAAPGTFAYLLFIFIACLFMYYIVDNWSEFLYSADDGETSVRISKFIMPVVCIILFFIIGNGLHSVQPNEAIVFSFFAKYRGSLTENGIWFVNPWYSVQNRVSMRYSNYAMEPITVNDKDGVPIEIGATIVYRIKDTYKATYVVDDLDDFIDNQFEIAIRNLAKTHEYAELSITDNSVLSKLLTHNVGNVGIEITECEITHLTYAQEIAGAMLRKQYANAISQAKDTIVKNAVDTAKAAAQHMTFDKSPGLKDSFIANLVLVMCSEKEVTPTITVNQ